jgi:uncharacterized membrane protein
MLDVLRFISIFAAGISAGTLVTVLAGFIPVMTALPPDRALGFKRLMDPLIDRYNPPAVIVAMISAVAMLFYSMPDDAKLCVAIGLAGSVGIGAVSLGVNMRINRMMSGWSSDAPPPEYRDAQQRWNRFHALRTLSSLVAFSAYILALLVA